MKCPYINIYNLKILYLVYVDASSAACSKAGFTFGPVPVFNRQVDIKVNAMLFKLKFKIETQFQLFVNWS
jgi:hypothetical protein